MGNQTVSQLSTPFYAGETGEIKLINGVACIKFKLEHINPDYHICITSEANEHYFWKRRTLTGFEIHSSSSRSNALVHWHVKD